MKQAELLQLYNTVVQHTGFVEDTTNPGWMPKLGPDDYRSVIRVPVILTSGTLHAAHYLIQESAPEGVRIIKNWPLATQAEKEEVARLYWDTVTNFPSYDLKEWEVSDYFVHRLNTALAAGRDYGVQTKGFISAEEKTKIIKFIFTHLDTLNVEPFFAHFSNTDIVKTGTEYLIWESPIVPKPEAAGIALWLWGGTLYAHSVPPDEWKQEMKSWIAAFKQFAPANKQQEFELKININLAERFMSTLLLDLPLKRSPFDKLSDAEVMKARELVRGLLNDIVPL